MSKTLSAAAQAISADLQSQLSFSKDTPDVEIDNKVYVKHAESAGLTIDGIVAVKEYDRTYVAGLLDATHVKALEAVVADPSLAEVKLTATSAGACKGESFDSTYVGRRSGTMKGSDGKPDTNWTSYGSVRAGHKSIISGKSGDLGAAMEHAATAGEEALKAILK